MNHPAFKAALFPAALAFASCTSAQSGDSERQSHITPTAGTVVEMPDTVPFEVLSHGEFDEPWAIAVEPGTGNVFITEKRGTAKFYQPANGRTGEVMGLPDVAYGGQGGLGDFAFAPDYTQSRMVYLTWAQDADGGKRRAVAARGVLDCEVQDRCRIGNLTEIWRQEPAIDGKGHYSHKIAFSPDGAFLFIASGDRQQKDPAQDNSNTLGTIVRLQPDGTPAPGNPFADQPSPTNQIWSFGHRNVLGLAFDLDGRLWDLEHGPRGGDELNKVEPGSNFGWPVRSYGINYNGDPIPDHSDDDGFAKPTIYWTPVIGPGDFLFYSGKMWPDWRGQALAANLTTSSIVRIAFDADKSSATEQARYAFPNRLRDIAEAEDGSIWLIEDGDNGRLLRITHSE